MPVTKTIDTWKLKKWWPIVAPKYLGGGYIGETPAVELRATIGRTINISLAAVTNDIKQQHINATFKIIGSEGNRAITELIKYEITPSYIRRHMRKGRTKVTDSFVCKTTGSEQTRIKPLVITRSKIVSSQETAIRKIAKATLKEMISKMSYEQFVQELLSQRLQRKVGEVLRKIAPLKSCEIRMMELLKKAAMAEKKKEEIKKETHQEKEEVKKEIKEETKEVKKPEEKEYAKKMEKVSEIKKKIEKEKIKESKTEEKK